MRFNVFLMWRILEGRIDDLVSAPQRERRMFNFGHCADDVRRLLPGVAGGSDAAGTCCLFGLAL